jgi:hypothetical protein
VATNGDQAELLMAVAKLSGPRRSRKMKKLDARSTAVATAEQRSVSLGVLHRRTEIKTEHEPKSPYLVEEPKKYTRKCEQKQHLHRNRTRFTYNHGGHHSPSLI